MMSKFLKIILLVLVIFALVNLLGIDYFILKENWDGLGETKSAEKQVETGNLLAKNETTNDCGEVCQKTISDKIQEELSKVTPLAGESSVAPLTKALPTTRPLTNNLPKILYIPLATNGSTVNTSWTDIDGSQFYFDLGSYPGAKEVRWETNLMALHGSALVYTRLYDKSNNRGVDYSDLSSQSSNYTRLESSGINIWRGNNLYSVQLRSANGTEADLTGAKLKILY
ncbi:MAG: hypothetical protein M1514_01010 [Patescibacteria group bacterium]|nr:hypothetical protein [Patescibacteria group bacterium]